MDIKNKKTALGDDASIYSRNRDAATKENMKNLTPKERFQYFLDYHSKKVIVILLIVAFAGMMLYETVLNPSTCVFSVACVDDVSFSDIDNAQIDLEEYIEIENENDYGSVSYYNREDYNSNTAFITHMLTGTIDIVLCSEEYFQTASEQGMFADLSTLLPEDVYESLSERMIESKIADTDTDGTVLSYGEELPYGIDISGSSKFEEFGGIGDKPILCVATSSQNTENILKIITYFTEFTSAE